MNKREAHKYSDAQKKMTMMWLRILLSVSLGAIVQFTVVPWAQAQRGYASFGGEYFLVLTAVVLPLLIFRR